MTQGPKLLRRSSSMDRLLRIWFATVFTASGIFFVVVFFLLFNFVAQGPESMGRAVGSFIKGIEEGRK